MDEDQEIKIHGNGMMKLIITAAIVWTTVILAIGVSIGTLAGYSAKQKYLVRQIEATLQEAIRDGRPVIFQDGHLGLILTEKDLPAGSTVAYRIVSILLPDPNEYPPINKFKKHDMVIAKEKKHHKRRVRKDAVKVDVQT
jgi:hypothetical protein